MKTHPMPEHISRKQLLNFWSHVDRSILSKCWEWTGFLDQCGYGKIFLSEHQYSTHRVAYFIFTGRDPGNLLVCHHCDNPKCIRFDHLFLGTQADNVHDCFRKGRGVPPPNARKNIPRAIGEKNSHSKLKEGEVLLIRSLGAFGIEVSFLIKMFKVTQESIDNILSRRTWKYI